MEVLGEVVEIFILDILNLSDLYRLHDRPRGRP
jgi:hypothetical protein